MSKAVQTELPVRPAQADAPADTSPLALLAKATATGATPEQIAKWMDLQERYDANEARKAFFAAMAAFQRDCPAIPRSKTVTRSGGAKLYDYAPLEVILQTIRATEAECGFRHSWDVEELDKGGVKVVCRISHVAGCSEQSSVTIPPTKGMNTNEAQDKGIIISYGQRRSLLNAYGLATGGEDTDGRTPGDEPPPAAITADEVRTLRSLLKAKGRSDDNVLRWASTQAGRELKTLEELPANLFAEAVRVLGGKA